MTNTAKKLITIDYLGGYENDDIQIKVTTGEISRHYTLPLEVAMYRGTRKQWGCSVGDNAWASFPDTEMYDTVLTDSNGNIVAQKKWNTIEDGDALYQAFYFYCKRLISEGKRPKGIAVGSHDGETGEWVPTVQENLTDACLVEASNPQFAKLVCNYQKYPNAKLVNQLITTEGQDIEFFEAGKGYTNSVVERVIRYWEKEEIKSSIRSSCSINDLIADYISSTDQLDWLHFDTEGYDIDLIRAIKEPLPPFIIFEEMHNDEQQKKSIYAYLRGKGYSLTSGEISCLAMHN